MAKDPNAPKKDRKKSTFTEILHARLTKTATVVAGIKRQFVRAALGGEEFTAIETAIAGLATKAAALATDFKPARVAAQVQPMAKGSEIEITEAKRAGLVDLIGADATNGKWIVDVATSERVSAHSAVDASRNCVFARRDVHLAGMARKPRAKKLNADGTPVAPKKRGPKAKVAPAATL